MTMTYQGVLYTDPEGRDWRIRDGDIQPAGFVPALHRFGAAIESIVRAWSGGHLFISPTRRTICTDEALTEYEIDHRGACTLRFTADSFTAVSTEAAGKIMQAICADAQTYIAEQSR